MLYLAGSLYDFDNGYSILDSPDVLFYIVTLAILRWLVMNRLRILARKSGIGGSLIPVLVKKKQQCIGIENKCFATMSSVSTLTDWKNSLPARYGVASHTVDVVSEPSMMYNLMMEMAKKSKKRIILSSLYLGNGRLESDLVEQLESVLQTSSDLHIHVLLDHCRGSRGKINSRTMLLPCISGYPQRMTLSLFHSPNLRGVLKTLLPAKFNELLGLQHMKFYIFDDTLILSGANLSNDYFTNRQDRCMVIRDCPQLCNYFAELAEVVASFSYQVNNMDEARLNHQCQGDPTSYLGGRQFTKCARQRMEEFLRTHTQSIECCDSPDTWIYPLIQMGSFNIDNENQAMHRLLQTTDVNDRIYLSTAYFNPSNAYIELITKHTDSEYHILASSPQANGFYTAAPPLRYIPSAYTWYEKLFLDCTHKNAQSHRMKLYEYSRQQWTFHAKGLWYYPADSNLPTMTIIGSSNYGYRSTHLDLEAQLVVSTTSPQLQEKLHNEQTSLYKLSDEITRTQLSQPSRTIPKWAQIVANAFRFWF